jgi:sulfur-oxidizing protein SoxY
MMKEVSASRRHMLAGSTLWSVVWASGLWSAAPPSAQALERAFGATSLDDALLALGGKPVASSELKLEVPELAENGAFVPVALSCTLKGVQELAFVVASNPYPLVARFTIPPGTEPFVSTRMKMADSGRVYAIARVDDTLHTTFRDIRVTVGGCG